MNVIGIDLGTTFSSVAIVFNNEVTIVKDKHNEVSIPSVINFKKIDSGIDITIGTVAKNRQKMWPKMTIYDSKRMLGKSYKNPLIQKLKSYCTFNIEESETGGTLVSVDGVDKKYQPYEISGEILNYLVNLANERFPAEERTNKVVITIPANFGDEQRMETMQAARYAGLEVLQLINEPTAAGLAFGLQNQITEPRYIFVFDFGGGTLDVSLLYQKEKEIEVKATDGDMFLGGRDFDENTVDFLIDELNLGNDFRKKRKIMNKLLDAVIYAKKELSESEVSAINKEEFLSNNEDEDEDENFYNLTREKFEEINSELIKRTLVPVRRIFEQNDKIKKEDVSVILLVGGSSKMNFVKRNLREFFGKEPYNGIDPEIAVALGAGNVASKYMKSRNSDVVCNDICPFSIGTPDYDGSMIVMIPKGTPIPSEVKTRRFQTVLYKQDEFNVLVYEGENKYANDNLLLGQFCVKNLPQVDEAICFDVSFQIDENGILHASAKLVNGDLYAKTDIKIEKSEKYLFNQSISSSAMSPITRNLITFYTNVQRFIELNRDTFEIVYSKEKVDLMIEHAKNQKENAGTIYETDINVHIHNYRYKIFKCYLRKYHDLPNFLRE